MEKLPKNIEDKVTLIKQQTGESPDIILRKVPYFSDEVYIIYVESLVDGTTINDFILEPLNEYLIAKKTKNTYEFIKNTLPVNKMLEANNLEDLLYNLLSGFSIILVDGEENCLSIETKSLLHSPISEAKSEKVVKGPGDGFTENYQVNVGLIRRRIKDPKLKLHELVVGRRAKMKVGIMYLDDVAKHEIVDEIMNKIKLINIDSILDSNYIIEMITNNRDHLFNNYISTERPDNVCGYILDGRIAIVVENTPYVVVVPGLFFDMIHSTEDMYQKSANAVFTRVLRLTAFMVTIIVPAFYIAVTTYNHEAIPTNLLISFATQRDSVPFPSSIEALFLILIFEILKETDARTPTNLGSALSIVGSIVLGEAAVSAGLVSPIMVIVVALTSICGLILPLPDMSNAARLWRIILLAFASLAGIFGLFIGLELLVISLASIESFGTPFVVPVIPFIKSGFGNILFPSKRRKFSKRNALFAPNNQTKGNDLE